ncbi:peptidase M24 [Spirochaetia bacterium]|nr:peptidase M24 [Spirochaetia bacterium]
MSIPLQEIQEAIRGEGLDGWLFCNFHHRDTLSDSILGIKPDSTNSRLWVYAVPVSGEPLGIVHAIEQHELDALPGSKISYISRSDLTFALKPLEGKSWGAHFSANLTAISLLDAGTASFFTGAGLRLVSAEGLIQRFKALLSPEEIESHERASAHLHEIVKAIWPVVNRFFIEDKALYEGDLRGEITAMMDERGLITDHPPIVGAGINSGNPHYDFEKRGALIRRGEVIQFDLWAKEKTEGSIYADISWVGVFSEKAGIAVEKAFADLIEAREGAISFIENSLASGKLPTGASVDRKTREILIAKGYEKALRHRTGHGIDTECHGSGVNIDSLEFPDERLLLDGSCFSLEPGIYFPDFGLRTEIDVTIRGGKAVVSGGAYPRQTVLLLCGE